jgi:sugar phosphate isomerase/epimerase
MKISFSTLACPAWNLDRVLDAAVRLGFDGIELRFIEMDDLLWERPEFSGAGLRQTVRRFNDAGIEVCCVDTSCFFHHPNKQLRDAALDMGKAMIGLAAELGAPAIRVFGDRVQPGADRTTTAQWIVEGVRTLAAYGRSSEVETWLETHGDFARTADTRAILQAAGLDGTGAIWDPLNSFSEFGEDPAMGFAELGALLRHVHIKDARRKPEIPWEPVLMREGDFPAADLVDLLRRNGYQGFVSYEWEKRWHPQIPEPDVALPHFMQWMRTALEK